jgi:hypothetical protein
VEKNQNQMDVKECVEICLNTQVLLVNYDWKIRIYCRDTYLLTY